MRQKPESSEPSLPTPSPAPAPSGLTFPVIGLGASAGGLSALRTLLEHLPADCGMALVIVLHLSPRHESNADKILQRCTRMPVVQVTTAKAIQANHVYVISPRLDLAMEDGHLRVTPSKRPRGPLVAVDLFFRTLADTHRDRAIGVILSGTGADGTLGIARLKEQGGVTIAQAPMDSEYEDMPRNAIASGHVDFVLPAADIAQKLVDIWANARNIALPEAKDAGMPLAAQEDTRPMTEDALRDIIAMLAERTGHDFSHYKRATMLRRMERRLQVRLLRDLPAYRDYLRSHPEETRELLADMLISVTNFFRDREAYEALEREAIPALFADRPAGDTLRAWVAGCATGEEAYSLAMLLQEETARHDAGHAFQIFATDIDERAIGVARRGMYPESIVADVPPSRLRTYFLHEDEAYRVKKAVREHILFAAHNALRDPPFSRLDIVSCRNVLIYLERDIQRKLLEMFHYSLRDGGVLFLGNSESVEACSDLFEAVDKRSRIFRAVNQENRRNPRLPLRVSMEGARPQRPGRSAATSQTAAAVHQRALQQYAPPSVIVDADASILHMSEHVGRFMRVPAGVPSHNLLEVVRPELRLDLRSALFQASQTRKSVETRRLRVDRDAQLHYVNMIVRPFTDPDTRQELLLVLFEEVQETLEPGKIAPAGPGGHDLVSQLEAELVRTREQLQATVELSDTSTQELKASNEELQAINEELRSTSEELETSTEELQSVNEELITVNAELKSKVDETERANDDLKNFIAATDIAAIFVDASMHIKRYTPRTESLFSLISADIGRSLLDITHRLDYPTLADDAAAAMETLQAVEREVRSVDGRWFVARIRPYQTTSRTIDGAVLTFIDVTSLRMAEERATRDADDLQQALQQSKDFAVVVTDAGGLITGWNEGAERVFGHTVAEAIGQPIHMIFLPGDVAKGRPEKEMHKARTTGRAEDDRWHRRKDGAHIYCSGVMTQLDVGDRPGFVKIVRDVTHQQELHQIEERKLMHARARRADAEAAIALKDEFLAVMSHELKHPLNLIHVNAELIGRAPDLGIDRSPVAAKALRTINRAVRTQSKIIDDLLDLSRMRTGKLALDRAAVDLVALAEVATEVAAADSAATGIGVGFRSAVPHVVVDADAARLNQIVWNLLSNAVKFTPVGGSVDVVVGAEGGFGRLDVKDSGIGIDPANLPRIFEMFGQARARATNAQSGLGIGLALVRQLAEHHGGRVEVVSDGPGKGSNFTVWIPLYVEKLGIESPNDGAKPVECCAGLRILVVDDDGATVESLKALLEIEGATVVTAMNVTAALAEIESERPDIVFTDLGMPDRDGYALLKEIRGRGELRALPVIALTGFGRQHDIRRAMKAGFTQHIAKPVDFLHLLKVIAEHAPGADAPAADA